MICIPGMPITCMGPLPGNLVGGAVGGALGNGFAEAMREGAAWVVTTTIGWWIDVPALDLTTSPAATIRSYVLWIALVVAAGGLMWQGLLTALTRRADPLLAAGRALFLLALWSAVAITGAAAALRAGDAFSSWVLDAAAHGQASDRLVALAGLTTIDAPGAVIVLGLVMMLAGLVQAVLMMFREGALVILAGVVVLAAAGSATTATRPWLPKVVGWMLALICYKPAAALVYASALTLVGSGDDPRTTVFGITMMLLSILALPALMRLFTWTTGAATTGAGGGGGLTAAAGALAAGIHATVAIRSAPGSDARTQSTRLASDLGPAGGTTTAPVGASPSGSARGPWAAPGSSSGPNGPGGGTPSGPASCGAGTATAPATAGAAGSGSGAQAGVATAGAASAGPAAPVAAAVLAGASTAAAAARSTANTITDQG